MHVTVTVSSSSAQVVYIIYMMHHDAVYRSETSLPLDTLQTETWWWPKHLRHIPPVMEQNT